MKLLGIDYGTKRVGIAVGDATGTIAFPRDVFENNDKLVGRIKTLCGEEGVEQIVLGESKDFQGNENSIMQELKMFKERLEEALAIPVVFEAEFSTTAAARATGTPDAILDAHAAALILQRYLDKQ